MDLLQQFNALYWLGIPPLLVVELTCKVELFMEGRVSFLFEGFYATFRHQKEKDSPSLFLLSSGIEILASSHKFYGQWEKCLIQNAFHFSALF